MPLLGSVNSYRGSAKTKTLAAHAARFCARAGTAMAASATSSLPWTMIVERMGGDLHSPVAFMYTPRSFGVPLVCTLPSQFKASVPALEVRVPV